ncbi:MAG: insulinase family protein [Clostridia bacterium]|nr:insulinase family protein [Clostridia bacterium]
MGKILKYDDNRFKSVYLSYNFTLKIAEEEIAKSVISCFALSKGSKKYRTSKEIEKYLASLYGSNFEVNVEKIGDLFNFEFRIICVNKNYLPNEEDVLSKCIDFLNEIIYFPNINDGKFDNEIFEREKKTVIDYIEKRKDEKIKYAVSRAEELINKGTTAGAFVYGDLEEAKNTSNEDCVRSYMNIINNSLKTVVISGNLTGYDNIEDKIREVFGDNFGDIANEDEIFESINLENVFENKITEVKEEMDTVQAAICVGMKNFKETEEDYYIANMYNAILGTTPSSKLFQNVREKASLAYTARSRYYRFKKTYVIYAGIEKMNYEKAKDIILEQISDMSSGNISDEEFNTAKASILSDLKEYKDSKFAMAKFLYMNYITKMSISLEDMILNFENVTKEDVITYAKNVEVKLIYFLGGEA